MSEKINQKNDTTTWQEIAYLNMIQLEDLTRLMVDKGLITKQKFVGEVWKVQESLRRREQQRSGDES